MTSFICEDTEQSLFGHTPSTPARAALHRLMASFYTCVCLVVCFSEQTFTFLIHQHWRRAEAMGMPDLTHSSWGVSWRPPIIMSGLPGAEFHRLAFFQILVKKSFEKTKQNKFCYSPEQICYKRQSPWGLTSVQHLSI